MTSFFSPVGIILDQAGRRASARYTGRDVTAHAVDAARQVAGAAATGVLSEGC